ncbi:MAG: Spo0B domain-containing protein [Clostridia bacterium]
MSDDQIQMNKQAEWVLQLLNQQRHDWLNHVQVLMSYLKLGRPERAEEYLKRVTEMVNQEGMISRIQFPQLSVFLLSFNALHNELRLDVKLDGPVDFSTIDLDQDRVFQLISSLVFAVKEHVDPASSETASLRMSFSQRENALVIRFDLEGLFTASGDAIVAKMVEQDNENTAALMAEWIHTEQETVLEARLPYRI